MWAGVCSGAATGNWSKPQGVFNLLPASFPKSKCVCTFFKSKVSISLFIYIYFWLCWVFISVLGLSLVAASGGPSSSRCVGLSLSRSVLLWSTCSRRAGSVAQSVNFLQPLVKSNWFSNQLRGLVFSVQDPRYGCSICGSNPSLSRENVQPHDILLLFCVPC